MLSLEGNILWFWFKQKTYVALCVDLYPNCVLLINKTTHVIDREKLYIYIEFELMKWFIMCGLWLNFNWFVYWFLTKRQENIILEGIKW